MSTEPGSHRDLPDGDQMRHIGTPNDTFNDCVRLPITQMIPENGLEGASTEVAGDVVPRSPRRGVKRPQRKRVTRRGRTEGVKVEGPHTRGKYDRSGPHTRSRSRSEHLERVARRLCLLCSVCWNPAERVSKAQSVVTAREESQRRLNWPRGGARAHVPAGRGARALPSPQRPPKTCRLKLSPTETSGVGGGVDDRAIGRVGRKVKRRRTGRVRALRAARVLKGKQIHLTAIPSKVYYV